jgi:hypothetical protein
MRLVDDWKKWHTWWSVRATGAAAALQVTLLSLPARVYDALPTWATHYAALATLVGIFVGRMVKQDGGDPKPPQ